MLLNYIKWSIEWPIESTHNELTFTLKLDNLTVKLNSSQLFYLNEMI